MRKAECAQCGKVFTEYDEGYKLMFETFCSAECLEYWAVENSEMMTYCDYDEEGDEEDDEEDEVINDYDIQGSYLND